MKRLVFIILALVPFLFVACNKADIPDFPKDELPSIKVDEATHQNLTFTDQKQLPSIEVYEAAHQNLTFTGQKQLHFVCDVVLPDQSKFNSVDNPEYFSWDTEEWKGVRNDGKGWFEFNGAPDEFKIEVVFQKDNVKLDNYIWVVVRE